MLYRISLGLIAFLSQVLAISDRQYRAYHAYLDAHDGSSEKWDGLDLPTSDQRALCRVLEEIPEYAERFYQYPGRWLTSYATDVDEEGTQMNTHMVADMKYREDLTGLLVSEREGMEALREMSEDEVERRVDEVRDKARKHWEGEGGKTGVPHRIWMR